MSQLEHIEAIEKRLWSAADNPRANSNYASGADRAQTAQSRRQDPRPDQGRLLPAERDLSAAQGAVRYPRGLARQRRP